MRYDEYRREGLPITGCYIESTIKAGPPPRQRDRTTLRAVPGLLTGRRRSRAATAGRLPQRYQPPEHFLAAPTKTHDRTANPPSCRLNKTTNRDAQPWARPVGALGGRNSEIVAAGEKMSTIHHAIDAADGRSVL